MNGIRSVQKLAADAAIEDQTTKEWAAGEEARKATAAAKKARKAASERSAAQKVGANRRRRFTTSWSEALGAVG